MKYSSFLVLTLILFLSSLAFGQDVIPLAEVSGSYQFSHMSASYSQLPVSVHLGSADIPTGWATGANVPVNRWIGAVSDIGGIWYSRTVHGDPAKARLLTFGGGAQFTYRGRSVQPYARFILGDANLHLSDPTLPGGLSTNSLFLAPGGGIALRASPQLWMRTGVDYFHTSKLGVSLNGVRVLLGIEYRIGGRRSQNAAQDSSRPRDRYGSNRSIAISRKAPHVGMTIPALGVVVITREANDGAEIVDVEQGSVAELAGLQVGDVINNVDGKAIHTPMELAAELSSRSAGSKIKIACLTSRYWHRETVLMLSHEN